MFVHLTKRMEFFVRVHSFIKRTNTNELPAERFMNCSLKVQFVCSPTHIPRGLKFLKMFRTPMEKFLRPPLISSF
ncbi:hypothetical protein Hanom_Chr17g01548711 [Helianthus anomalus]